MSLRPLRPVPSDQVKIHGDFWASRQAAIFSQHAISSQAPSTTSPPPNGAWRSELKSWLEVAAASLGSDPDPAAITKISALVTRSFVLEHSSETAAHGFRAL